MFAAGDDEGTAFSIFQIEKDCKPIEELVKDPKPLPREMESIIQFLYYEIEKENE